MSTDGTSSLVRVHSECTQSVLREYSECSLCIYVLKVYSECTRSVLGPTVIHVAAKHAEVCRHPVCTPCIIRWARSFGHLYRDPNWTMTTLTSDSKETASGGAFDLFSSFQPTPKPPPSSKPANPCNEDICRKSADEPPTHMSFISASEGAPMIEAMAAI